jgi:hypothetical protein
MKRSKALTWNQVANEYNKISVGRPAMTLPMNYVFEKLSKAKGFIVDEKKGTIHKIIKTKNKMKTLLVAFINHKDEDPYKKKVYTFNTNDPLTEGDVIKSDRYSSILFVVKELKGEAYTHYCRKTGDLARGKINEDYFEIMELQIVNDLEGIDRIDGVAFYVFYNEKNEKIKTV